MSLSKETRQSVLNDRHVALGADMTAVAWNDMPIPHNYKTDPYDETAAVRFASAAAALKVQRKGGRSGAPTRAELDSFLAARCVA